ncbi:hypothetical protein GCM10022384_07460 [Streptomyces marokkonensis]|uniref:Uncharacterized protein n=1 Tax=Streptomyces marokkonensis TaxID=324855 RepID=A0ABP7NYZ0_9ACTN
MTSQGADELRVLHYLHQLDVHPAGHHHAPPVPPPSTSPPEDTMLLLAICLAGLAPGLATVWLLRRKGWLLATLTGLAVTLALPGLLILAMVAMPPLGYVIAVCSVVIAVRAFDEGRVWVGCAWAVVLVVSFACAGVL